MNYYQLDSGVFHSVSVSGGLTSAYLARHIQLSNPGGSNIVYLFANTGLEHDLTYQFLADLFLYWGLPLVALEYIPEPPGYRVFSPPQFSDLSRRGEPFEAMTNNCLLYTSPSPRDRQKSRMPSSA